MIHPIDDRLRDEARRFRLVFACVDCASFDPGRDAGADDAPNDGGRCSLGFPNEAHRDPDLHGRVEGRARAEVTFCKAFELR